MAKGGREGSQIRQVVLIPPSSMSPMRKGFEVTGGDRAGGHPSSFPPNCRRAEARDWAAVELIRNLGEIVPQKATPTPPIAIVPPPQGLD